MRNPNGRALYIKFTELSLNLKEGKLNSFHTLYTPITLQICLLGDPYGFEAAGGGGNQTFDLLSRIHVCTHKQNICLQNREKKLNTPKFFVVFKFRTLSP